MWKISAKSNSATSNAKEKIITLESSIYAYYPNTLMTKTTGKTVVIDTTSEIYKMLFTDINASDSSTDINLRYWLGSSYINTTSADAVFGMRNIREGKVDGYYLCSSYIRIQTRYLGVRPVVTLSSEISFTDSGSKRDGCTLWNME